MSTESNEINGETRNKFSLGSKVEGDVQKYNSHVCIGVALGQAGQALASFPVSLFSAQEGAGEKEESLVSTASACAN